MSRSLPKDGWSDGGDPAKARRLAWMWVLFALIAWSGVGLIRFAWWIAQVNDYQENYRGFNAGDPFPWIVVILICVTGVACLPIAVIQAIRARHLAQQQYPKPH